MKAGRTIVLSDEAISAFWQWFLSHHRDVELMLDRNEGGELARQINSCIDRLSSQLAWEIGPGLVEPYMFVFPTAGDSALKAAVSKIMKKAPRVEGWEFHASRPARPFQREIQLPDRGLSIQAAEWRFSLMQSKTSDRFNLQVFDNKLASFDEKTALTAVFILLDSVLGEDVTERWIGNIKIFSASAAEGDLPMSAIAERLGELISEVA